MPLFLISGLVLGGCMGNNGAIPKNNETPMENVEDRTRDWTPKVRDEQRGGSDLDGVDTRQDNIDNGVRDGVINDDVTNPDQDMFRGENAPREGIIEDNLDRNDENLNNR